MLRNSTKIIVLKRADRIALILALIMIVLVGSCKLNESYRVLHNERAKIKVRSYQSMGLLITQVVEGDVVLLTKVSANTSDSYYYRYPKSGRYFSYFSIDHREESPIILSSPYGYSDLYAGQFIGKYYCINCHSEIGFKNSADSSIDINFKEFISSKNHEKFRDLLIDSIDVINVWKADSANFFFPIIENGVD